MASIRKQDQKHQLVTNEQSGVFGDQSDLPNSYKIFDPNDQPQAFIGKDSPFATPAFGQDTHRVFHQTHQMDTTENFTPQLSVELGNTYGDPVG